VALALLLAPAPAARADLIPWSYSWSQSPTNLYADSPGSSYIQFTGEPPVSVVGDSDVVAANLKTFSSAPAGSPDHFTHAGYTLTLNLFDPTSNQSGTLTFSGHIDGTLSSANSNLTNTFDSTAPQTLQLGSTVFIATVDQFTHPGIPTATTYGSISGNVAISVQTVIVSMPEPGTLALSGVGLIVLGVARWRRARPATSRRSDAQRRSAGRQEGA
jgi:hypothetical protein